MDDLSGSNVVPTTTAEAHVNQTPPGFVELFTEDGRSVLVREGDAASVGASLALREERYDLDAAEAEFQAAHAAVAEVVDRTLAEFRHLGYTRDESFSVLNLAQGRAIDSYRNLMRTIGGSLPSEALVQSIAEQKQQLRSPDFPWNEEEFADRFPRLARHEEVADRYAASIQEVK